MHPDNSSNKIPSALQAIVLESQRYGGASSTHYRELGPIELQSYISELSVKRNELLDPIPKSLPIDLLAVQKRQPF